MTTKKKTVCRSSNKKSQSVSPVGKHSQTLKSARKECFGIGRKSLVEVDVEKYGRGKRRKGQTIDYLKLNDGEEDLDRTPVPPKKDQTRPNSYGDLRHTGRVHKNRSLKALSSLLCLLLNQRNRQKKNQRRLGKIQQLMIHYLAYRMASH